MNLLPLIQKKKLGQALSAQEIHNWIQALCADAVEDYQLSALLMAICWQGMNDAETLALTLEMAHSGETADLSSIPGHCIDKHSTGGVGDTTTLILTPLVAACGVPVAKMSGRGLGHTGGTVDKLESIPGFQTERTIPQFLNQLQHIGCAVIAQSERLAPADKRLYAMRDVTDTINNQALIASSIMSKKIAAGCKAIVLDVKTGSGAFLPTLDAAVRLAQAMVRIGEQAGRRTLALITDMDQPLGTHIGNALEVREACDILTGRAGGRLLEASLALGEAMLVAGGRAESPPMARALLEDALHSGAGARRMRAMIEAQGGNPAIVGNPDLLPSASLTRTVTAASGGVVRRADALSLGLAAQALGAGRTKKGEKIDLAAGIILRKQVGDTVAIGAPLAILHGNSEERLNAAEPLTRAAFQLGDEPADPAPLVLARVDAQGVTLAQWTEGSISWKH